MNARLSLAPLWGSRGCADNDGVQFASSFVRGLCEALRAFGHDSSAFLARVGIEPGRLSASDEWFALDEVDTLIREAVATTRDPAFGLHWGERSPMMQFDLGPSLVASAPSLRDALDAIVQIQFVFVNRAQCFFIEEGSRSTISLDLLTVSEVGKHLMTELSLASLLRGFRYLGHSRAIRRINVAYARPPHGAEYERVFGPRLRFDRPRTSIEFASAVLDRRAGTYSEPLHRMIRSHTEDLRQRVMQQVRHTEQVEGQLRTALPRVPSIGEVAQALGTSARSLRRRLADENASFSELVDRVQRTRAEELLARGSLSVKEIAHEAGFLSPSGFQRAYRRWTGTSPGRNRGELSRP